AIRVRDSAHSWDLSPSPELHWTMLRIARRNSTSPRWGEVNGAREQINLTKIYRESDRRQHGKSIARLPQAAQFLAAGLVEHRFDPRRWRTVPAQRDHLRDRLGRSRKQRFDAAVAAIAHPSLQMACNSLVFDPGAVTDALHPAPDRHMKDGAR